jgi:putative iron-dependent peroxidase
MNAPPGILAPVPRLARYLSFQLRPASNPITAVTELAELADGDKIVVGLGASLLGAMDQDIDGTILNQRRMNTLNYVLEKTNLKGWNY